MPITHYNGSDRLDTVVYRIPLEIWEQILVDSISYPILPSSEDRFLDTIKLLSHDPEACLEVEQARTRLRLVCKGWNEMLKKFPDYRTYYKGSVVSLFPSSALRLEIVEPGFRRDRYDFPCHVSSPPLGLQEGTGVTDQTIQYPSVEALVLITTEENRSLIERFPSLRLLSTLCFDPVHIKSTCPSLVWSLTHLQIPPVYPRSGRNVDSFGLSNLHTLSIDISSEYYFGEAIQDLPFYRPFGGLAFLDWDLPKLNILRCFGKGILFEEEGVGEALMERFGSTLTGLSWIVYRAAGIPISLPSSTWRLCPNLRTLHTFLTNITPYLRPPLAHPPVRLIFGEFGCSDYWRNNHIYYHSASYTWFDYEVSISLFLALSWPVEEFEMDLSWRVLQNRLMNTPYYENLEMMYNCLERMLWAGRDIKDRYGAGILSDTARALMDRLKSFVNDPNRKKDWWEEVKIYEESDAEFTESEDGYEYSSETEDSDIDGTHFLLYGDYGDSDEDDSDYVEDDMDAREVHTDN